MYNNSIPSVVSPRQFICSSPLANSAVLSALLSTVTCQPLAILSLFCQPSAILSLSCQPPAILSLSCQLPYPCLALSSFSPASRRSITLDSSHPVQLSLWTGEPVTADVWLHRHPMTVVCECGKTESSPAAPSEPSSSPGSLILSSLWAPLSHPPLDTLCC